MRFRLLFIGLLMALLSGCGGGKEATVYTVPKAPPAGAATPSTAAGSMTGPTPGSMAGQTLPDGAVNREGNPVWAVPAHWTSKPGSPMRRASFTVPGAEATVDIAVTSFPGDVGGALANVNRWRGQLDLPPLPSDALAAILQPLPTAGAGEGTLVRLENGALATYAVTLEHAGNSWFFKMTGPRELVDAEREAFLAFVRSTNFAPSGT